MLKLQTPDNEILFGLFSLCAAGLETWEQGKETFFPFRKEGSLTDAIKKSDISFLQFIRWILVARFETVPEDMIVGEFKRCRFGPQQKAFISRWVNRETNLVAIPLELRKRDRSLMVWTPPLLNGIVMCQSGDETTT